MCGPETEKCAAECFASAFLLPFDFFLVFYGFVKCKCVRCRRGHCASPLAREIWLLHSGGDVVVMSSREVIDMAENCGGAVSDQVPSLIRVGGRK